MKTPKLFNSDRCLALALLAFAILSIQFSTARAQGTAFTYQGRLNSAGSSANGNYDFTFSLFNTSSTNSGQVGTTQILPDVGVTNGLFTVTLDFGANFPGASRWLAIGVRTNGAASFTALNPLQELDPTPYAIYAPNAGTAASASSVAASNISGTIPLGQLAGTVLTNGETNVALSGTFTGNGGGLTNLSAWQLAGNTGTTSNNFLGTTDNQSLQIRVGGAQAGLFTPSNGSPNIVLGAAQNVVSNGTAGASILGGVTNTIGTNSSYSVIGGGNQNGIQPGAGNSFLGSGFNNTIQTNATYSVLGGGYQNSIQSGNTQTVLGGGYQNSIQSGAIQSVLVGGFQNSIQNGGGDSFLGGGEVNSILSGLSFLGGGYFNSIAGSSGDSVLVGGEGNSIASSAGYSFLGGGQNNAIAINAEISVIGGGANNKIVYGPSVIGGGVNNTVGGFYAFIGGGGQNNIGNGQYSTLGGGQFNSVVDAYYAFIGAGLQNTNSANYAFIGGGLNNLIGTIPNAGLLGSISGGQSNTVNGNWGTVPGGASNLAGGQFSFAAGANAQATNNGAFVWSDAEGTPFASTNANSFNVRANGGVRLMTGGVGLTVDGSPVLSGNNGSGLVNLNASQLTSGTVPLARLPSGVVTNNEPNVSLGSLTLGGNLNLPFPPVKFTTGPTLSPLLSLDLNDNAFFGGAGGESETGTQNTGIGFNALLFNQTGNYNTAMGVASLEGNLTGSSNTANGVSALASLTSGNNNIGLGYNAGNSLTSGNNDIYIGNAGGASESGIIRIGTPGTQTQTYVAGELFASSLSVSSPPSIFAGGAPFLSADTVGNTSLGLGAGRGNNGQNNTFNGFGAFGNGTGGANVVIGASALGNSTAENQTVAIGYGALQNDAAVGYSFVNAFSGGNTAVGYQALQQDTTGADNAAVGYEALQQNVSGRDNTAVGNLALDYNTTGSYNTSMGSSALYENGTGSNNTANGFVALTFNMSGSYNTATGSSAMELNTNGSFNTADGAYAMNNNLSGNYNTANGCQAMGNINSFLPNNGNYNTADGALALGFNSIGAKNVACGYSALGASQTGSDNVAVGNNSLAVLENNSSSGGDGNTAVGHESLFNLTSGNGNIAIGFLAGMNNTAGNNNIYIGNLGVNGDNDIIYIGTAGTQVATYLVGNVYAEKNVYASSVQLTSDRNLKENFQPVDNQAVLAKVASLPVTEWNYKTDKAGVQHIGPMAQDFQAAFGLDGADDKHISVVDEGGVALAAIQGLNQKLNEKDAEIQKLKEKTAQVDALEKRLADLENMVQALTANK